MKKNSTFMIRLTSTEWNKDVGGWQCEPLRQIPGASLKYVLSKGKKLSSDDYELEDGYLRWIGKEEKPQNVNVCVELRKKLTTEESKLKLEKDLHNWKKLGILDPIITALIAGFVTCEHPKDNGVSPAQSATPFVNVTPAPRETPAPATPLASTTPTPIVSPGTPETSLVPGITPSKSKPDNYVKRYPENYPTEELYRGLFYNSANQELAEAVNSLISGDESEKTGHKVSFVIGPAGIGKTTIIDPMSDALVEAGVPVIRIGLADTFLEGSELVEMRPFPVEQGIAQKKISFGKARFVKNVGKINSLDKLLTLANERNSEAQEMREGCVVIIDDLDEIHPTSSNDILRIIGKSAVADKRVRHLFFFGRTEAFRGHLSKIKRHFPSRTFRMKSYNCSNTTELLSAILCINDVRDNPQNYDIKYIVDLIEEKAFLWEMIQTFKGLAMVTSASLSWSGKDNLEELQMKKALYDELMRRNRKTHGRGVEYEKEYQSALTEIAKQYLNEAIDNEGKFSVGMTDPIEFLVEDQKGQKLKKRFLVQDVLSYSGLVEIYPVNTSTQDYRFLPTWIHSYLVESSLGAGVER